MLWVVSTKKKSLETEIRSTLQMQMQDQDVTRAYITIYTLITIMSLLIVTQINPIGQEYEWSR